MSRLHQFGPIVLPGFFFGYVLYAGRIWKGDSMVADIGDFQADERLKFYIHSRRWNSQRLWRRSTSENIRLNQGSSGPRRRKTSSSHPRQADSTRYDAEAKNDFLSITGDFICHQHVESRVKLYVPREQSFLIPLKYIDLAGNADTSLDVLMEKILMITGAWKKKENYQMQGQVSQDLFCWTNGHLTDIHGPEGDWWRNKRPQDPTMCGRYVEVCVWCIEAQSEAKMAYLET